MSKPNLKPAIVLFGRTGLRSPRAAWCCLADAAVALWIAQHQPGFTLLRATADLLKSLETPLQEWQLDPDGQPLIPVVSMKTFARLQSLASQVEAGDPIGLAFPDAKPDQPALTPDLRQASKLLWDGVGLHSLVLAREDDPADGWWEAIVLAMRNGTCTLCWRDFPEQGLIRRKRQQLALPHPAD